MYNKGPKEREKVKKEGKNFGNFFFKNWRGKSQIKGQSEEHLLKTVPNRKSVKFKNKIESLICLQREKVKKHMKNKTKSEIDIELFSSNTEQC
jgi:hypothetical protein